MTAAGEHRRECLGDALDAFHRGVDAVPGAIPNQPAALGLYCPPERPVADGQTITTELGQKDLGTDQKRQERARKNSKMTGKPGEIEKRALEVCEQLAKALDQAKPARLIKFDDEPAQAIVPG